MALKQSTINLGTVMVIGGCGFLGSNIVDQLLNFPTEPNPAVHSPSRKGTPIYLSSSERSLPKMRGQNGCG